ncbi:hypothetical protein [Streptomyces sp. Amel2xB2]|uniref:hypothetical protein n=1 Tax=Streptomyces sp. Amel2xB2 TaxID=1305829 RepID=UPI0015EB32F9|nr:hypothetical protein [Streptomyces sp. Amel2xB2]
MTEDEGHDPGAEPEDEGIPDLQDGWPEAELAEDPQRAAVPGDEPVAVESYGTTFDEQVEGEPLDERLAEEEPDVGDEEAEPLPDEPAGQLSDDPLEWRSANQDTFSSASPAEGLSGEETAVHVADDDDRELGLELEDIEQAAEGPDPRPPRAAGPERVDMDTDEDE